MTGMPARTFDDANAFQKAMRTFASTAVGVALFRPTGHHLDKAVSRLTKGRRSFAGIVTGIPAVILTTTGAKSGEPRTVVVAGVPRPEGLGLIASNWGGTTHPAWYHNLRAHPRCTITVEGDTWEGEARPATPEERDEIWAKGLELYPGWRKYEARAGDRTIQAFVVERQPAPRP
jgi:deazaflavin-dependent oxidoreductase (nitroreductase family)